MSSWQDLKFLKLDTASLGVQEVFKSALLAVKVPTELLNWVRSVLWEYINEKGHTNTNIQDLIVAIRTKAVENGYSSKQVMETIERATTENRNRIDGQRITSRYQKLAN